MALPKQLKSYEDTAPINAGQYLPGDYSDAAPILNALADECRATGRSLYIPDGVRIIAKTVVNFVGVRNIQCDGYLFVDADGRVDIGDTANQRNHCKADFRGVVWLNSSQTNVTLRVVGAKQAVYRVGKCSYMQLLADGSDPLTGSISYCTFTLGRIETLEFVQRDGATAKDFGWITECLFIGGDVKKIQTSSVSYRMNLITFFKTCLESGEVRLDYASKCRFVDVRCEYGTKFWFGANTDRISVQDSFISYPASVQPGLVVMEDLGVENVVKTSFEENYSRRAIWSIDADTVILDKCANVQVANIEPALDTFVPTAALASIFDTGLIPVRGKGGRDLFDYASRWSIPKFLITSDTASFRCDVMIYDATGTQLAAETECRLDGGGVWDTANKKFTLYANVAGAMFHVGSPTVSFIRIIVKSAYPITEFKRMEVTAFFSGPSTDSPIKKLEQRYKRDLFQEEKPSQGLAPFGTIVHSSVGSWSARGRAETSLSETANGTTIKVGSINGIAVGDVVGVRLDTGRTAWASVTSVSATTLTLSKPLPSQASAGAQVATIRW